MSYRILFVCSGNTCRSAMAVYLAAAVKEKEFSHSDFLFDSAGIATTDGYPAADNAVAALAEWGIDMRDHRSKKFQSYMVAASDLIIGMTAMHRDVLRREYPEAEDKIFVIGEISGSGKEIPDPYLGSLDLYCRTRDSLKLEITNLLEDLEKKRK